jgi:PHD/YefM family antitoxin component YafN of YafNO toxin-antitoxin module
LNHGEGEAEQFYRDLQHRGIRVRASTPPSLSQFPDFFPHKSSAVGSQGGAVSRFSSESICPEAVGILLTPAGFNRTIRQLNCTLACREIRWESALSMAQTIRVKKVSATDFRDDLKEHLKTVKDNTVLLIENRRQVAKYVVDRKYLDRLVEERESILATLEILADRELTNRLVELKKSGLSKGKLYTIDEVLG